MCFIGHFFKTFSLSYCCFFCCGCPFLQVIKIDHLGDKDAELVYFFCTVKARKPVILSFTTLVQSNTEA